MTNISNNKPFYYSPSGDKEEDKKLLEPIEYIFQCVEQHEYTKLTLAFNHWFKVPFDIFQRINEIVHITFGICILYDDIQDNSILREGYPVAHSVFGLSNTINAANYGQLIAIEKAVILHPSADNIVKEQLIELWRGQGTDMYWKDKFICPTDEEYKIMAVRKTAWLIKLIVKLMKLFSIYEEDLSSLINLMGFYYQIHNDYSNLCFYENENNENFYDDITGGNFTFPIIHAITSNPDDRQIINILKRSEKDINMKRHCIKLLEIFGSFKYTRDVLQELHKKIEIEIERLGGNPYLSKIFDNYKKKLLNHHVVIDSKTEK